MPRDWDARTYDRVADPMTRWGSAVLDRLPLRGDERVLDAGCGSGRVTEQLAERLPDGRVIALDGSPSMVEAARERLARFGDRIEYVVADLGAPLPIEGDVDAVLSTATFHWVPDHDALFANLAAVTAAGRLAGRAVRRGGQHRLDPAGAGDDRRRLAGARPLRDGRSRRRAASTRPGFVDIECWLTDEPTRFEPGEPFETYLRTVVLGAHLERLPPSEHDAFVAAVADRRRRAADRLRPAQHRRRARADPAADASRRSALDELDVDDLEGRAAVVAGRRGTCRSPSRSPTTSS